MKVNIGYNKMTRNEYLPHGRRYFVAVEKPGLHDNYEYLHSDGIIRGAAVRQRAPNESPDVDTATGYYQDLRDACSKLREYLITHRVKTLDITFDIPEEIYPKKAYELIEVPEHWTKEVYARTEPNGESCTSHDERATCFCALGALQRVYGFIPAFSVAVLVTHNKPHHDIVSFNDNEGHKAAYELLKKANV